MLRLGINSKKERNLPQLTARLLPEESRNKNYKQNRQVKRRDEIKYIVRREYRHYAKDCVRKIPSCKFCKKIYHLEKDCYFQKREIPQTLTHKKK